MKADQVLIEHHDVLRGLLTQLEETTDEQGEERKALLDSLVSELGVHVRIEDEIFYPAVEKVTPLLAISQAEHRAIDDQLAVVLRTDTDGQDFATEVKMLAATLHHHAGEETPHVPAVACARRGGARSTGDADGGAQETARELNGRTDPPKGEERNIATRVNHPPPRERSGLVLG